MHDKFKLAQSQRQFARLMGLAREQREALEKDPVPFLIEADREVSRIRALLDDIKDAYGVSHASYDPNARVEYEPVDVRSFRQLEKIKKLIRDFESTKENHG